jgi:hypothetical protein
VSPGFFWAFYHEVRLFNIAKDVGISLLPNT